MRYCMDKLLLNIFFMIYPIYHKLPLTSPIIIDFFLVIFFTNTILFFTIGIIFVHATTKKVSCKRLLAKTRTISVGRQRLSSEWSNEIVYNSTTLILGIFRKHRSYTKKQDESCRKWKAPLFFLLINNVLGEGAIVTVVLV